MKELKKENMKEDIIEKSFYVIQKLKEEIARYEKQYNEPIAIIGMACRLPGGCDSPESYWELLMKGVNAVKEVPKDRWDVDRYFSKDPDEPGKAYARYCGFIDDIDTFDAKFFRTSPREAKSLDPQQRIILEVAWESIESAAIAPESLKNSNTGVFLGVLQNEYTRREEIAGDTSMIDVYSGSGNILSFAAGRLSHKLGLQGPSMVIETACSSSLVAIHQACQSIRMNECEMALAGGIQLLLSPDSQIYLSKIRGLSPSRECKTFDNDADGFIRGEGCGIIVLKRLSKALADNDNILAVIKGSAINHDGPSAGLMVPNGLAQEKCIESAVVNSRVNVEDISYIESHGTGTPIGDPIEIEALGNVLCKNRDAGSPLVVGSVKTNIGHLEPASGAAAIIKVILMMKNRTIPPHINFKKPSEHIRWDKYPIKVPTEAMSWDTGGKLIAGINAFGFSGTNAHIVIEEPPVREKKKPEHSMPLHMLTLSARTQGSLKRQLEKYHEYLKNNKNVDLADLCYTTNTGRSKLNNRLSIVAGSVNKLLESMGDYLKENKAPNIKTSCIDTDEIKNEFVFLYSPRRINYRLFKDLYDMHPYFRKIIYKCEDISMSYFGQSIVTALYDDSPSKDLRFPDAATFAVQYALSKLLMVWGIEPCSVIGIGTGELAAACVAGGIELEQAVILAKKLEKCINGWDQNVNMQGSRELDGILGGIGLREPNIEIISGILDDTLSCDRIINADSWFRKPSEYTDIEGILKKAGYGEKVFIEIGGAHSRNMEKSDIPGGADFIMGLKDNSTVWDYLFNTVSDLYHQGIDINWNEFHRYYQRNKLMLPTYAFDKKKFWL